MAPRCVCAAAYVLWCSRIENLDWRVLFGSLARCLYTLVLAYREPVTILIGEYSLAGLLAPCLHGISRLPGSTPGSTPGYVGRS